jgi:hypothetical protein
MAIPDDAHYTDRSRHNVRLGDGRTVSRATAENIAAHNLGYRSNYERRLSFRDFRHAKDSDKLISQGERQGRTREDIIQAYGRLQADYRIHGNDYSRIDRSHDGPLAQWLTAIGRRSSTDIHAVGETPGLK